LIRAVCAVVIAIGLAPAVAAAQASPVTRMRFTEKDDRILVTTTINKLFDAAAYEALGSGFESAVLVRLWVYREGSSEVVGFQILQRRVIYDMWDEVYEIQLDGPGRRRKVKVKQQAEALKVLTTLEQVPIAVAGELPYEQTYRVVIVAELNPVSAETLAEVRRWLTKGAGGGLDRGGGLFGSVVSVFVNPKIADADRVLRLRSQPFYRPRPD
jgi:hypothetical protein